MPAAQQRHLADVDDGRPLRSLPAGFAGKRRRPSGSAPRRSRLLPGVARVWFTLVGVSILLLVLATTADLGVRLNSAVASGVTQYRAEWGDVLARGAPAAAEAALLGARSR